MSFTSPTNTTNMSNGNSILARASEGDNTKGTEDVENELCLSSKYNHDLVLTPRTEASTPEYLDPKTNSVSSSDGINCVIKSPRDASSSESSADEEQDLKLQRHMSQTDNHICMLDRNGDLNEVAGSQSMLSQELMDHGNDHSDSNNSGDEEATETSTAPCLLEDLGLKKGSQPESSIGIAKRLGLLPHTQEEGGEESQVEDDEGLYARHKTQSHRVQVLKAVDDNKQVEEDQHVGSTKTSPRNDIVDKDYEFQFQKTEAARATRAISSSQRLLDDSSRKTPISGLELLTQVGIKEANKAAAMTSNGHAIDNENVSNKAIAVAAMISIPKTTVYPNEGFGSLLDAVAKITEQEASGLDCSMDWVSSQASNDAPTRTKRVKKRKKPPVDSKGSTTKVQRKSETQKLKEKIRREKIELENERAQATAKRAAIIAEHTTTDPVIAKKLLLSMALARENPRSIPKTLPGKGHVVQKSFFWAHYPPLEMVLKKHMAEYYELSTHQCQSREQQAFNNYMVDLVKDVADQQEWKFADSFCDKSLRDRIRCYYKTHIQNAKKRLRTMVRNPTKKANARHLCEHLDLIQKHRVEEGTSKAKPEQGNEKNKKK